MSFVGVNYYMSIDVFERLKSRRLSDEFSRPRYIRFDIKYSHEGATHVSLYNTHLRPYNIGYITRHQTDDEVLIFLMRAI